MFVFMFRTGASKGEVRAIRKSNVNNNKILIDDSQGRTKLRNTKRTKAYDSKRIITIDSRTEKMLIPFLETKEPFLFGGVLPPSINAIDYCGAKE